MLRLVDPERALAVAYAPAALRPALTALFALDERMGAIVGTTDQPMIGLMRLAWWREALERLDRAPAPSEPLLQALALDVLPRGVSGASLAALEEGWAVLLDDDPVPQALAGYGTHRGGTLFAAAAVVLGARDPELAQAGAGWALADLAARHSSPAVRLTAREQARASLDPLVGRRWTRAGRPLAALAVLARRDVNSAEPRRQGAPARLARMLALRLTGR